MFRAFAPIIRSTKLRLAAYGILSYLQLGGGVKSRRVSRVCGADAPHTRFARRHQVQYIVILRIPVLTSVLLL
jgi:hypothetical protein